MPELFERGEDLILVAHDPAIAIVPGYRRYLVGLDIAQAQDRTAYSIILDERIPFYDENGRQELGKRRREIVAAAQLPQLSYSDLAIVARNLMMDPSIAGRAYLVVDSSWGRTCLLRHPEHEVRSAHPRHHDVGGERERDGRARPYLQQRGPQSAAVGAELGHPHARPHHRQLPRS